MTLTLMNEMFEKIGQSLFGRIELATLKPDSLARYREALSEGAESSPYLSAIILLDQLEHIADEIGVEIYEWSP